MAVLATCVLSAILSASVVLADYPPPSEDGHRYYSRRSGSGPSLVGIGRVSSSFGPMPDWTGTDWSSLNAGGHGSARCVEIPSNLSLCRNMEYTQMRLPNLLEHDTLREVSQQASSWVRLLQVSCHSDTQIFLCSLFAPVCLDRPVWPCRSLCEAVKSGCEDRMLRYGFPWPEMLRCDQYPLDEDLCIGLRSADNRGNDDESCPACTRPEKYNNIIEDSCASDFVMRIKVEQTVVSGEDLKIIAANKRKIYRTSVALKSKEVRDLPLFIEAGAACDCGKLENTRHSPNYLIMGRKVNDRLVIDNVVSLNQRSNDVARATRKLRDRSICRQGMRLAATVASATAASTGSRTKKPVQPGNRNRKYTTSPILLPGATTAIMSVTTRNRPASSRTQTAGSRRHQVSESEATRSRQ